MASEVRIESGIEVITTSVLRQLPRNSKIMTAVRSAAIAPSVSTPAIAARTKSDWSNSSLISIPGGAAARIVGKSSFSCLTIVSVEAPPFLMTVSSAERRPSWRTMFVCTAKPSRT